MFGFSPVMIAAARGAIEFIAAASGTTSASFSAPQAGDLILVFKSGRSQTPSIATGFTDILSSSSGGTGRSISYKISNGTETSVGVTTNTNTTLVLIYRGVAGIGDVSTFSTGSGTVATFDALTIINSNSWAAAFIVTRAEVTVTNPPSGMVNRISRNNISSAGGHDTNGAVSSWSSQTASIVSSSDWSTIVVELLAA